MNIKLLVKKCLLSLILFQIFKLSISINTINSTQPLRDDGNPVVSTNQVFSLGFFSPGESTRRFVGIWYSKVPETVVWVLNRDNPINGTAGVLTVDDNRGNLVLYENNQTRGNPLWSSKANVSSSTAPFEAQLLDSGNLVLVDRKNNSNWIWESFDFPTDTTIPNMKLGVNRKTGKNWFLSSWKSRDDPATGNIFLRINPAGFPQVFLYNGSIPLWRSGPWIGQRWSGIAMAPSKVFKPTFVNNKDEVSITYSFFDMTVASSILTRKTVNESGIFEQTAWNSPSWVELWSGPKEPCDKYGRCGTNSKCEPNDSSNFKCECLPGFEQKSVENGSDGCIRKTGASTCQNMEGFIKLTNIKLPDTSIARANMSMELKACEEKCLKNCSCTAYTSADESGIGCLNWFGDLIDTTNFSDAGQDLYVRVDATELGKYMKSKGPFANGRFKAIIIVSVLVPFFSIFAIYYLIKKMRKGRDRRRRKRFLLGLIDQGSENGKGNDDEGGISDLPFFDLSVIAAVTNNFSDDNKLGKGGFGTVYKGVLPGGKEIAVKRLSKYSGQGNDEFKNEVALIAKLQHRNLVKLLGYCIQDQEKMLIYEFLPNKSLDTFIFDDAKRALLNWSMRHEIICGIARGILYLHQDSRLRIIHRDLKASNILLDASMKPKISDFGMARIFEANQIEAETHRVVGTYGYMAPEYAMQGQFSVKSDVYSFGILLLEIISGRKNSSFYNEIRFSNLAGHVWELWREGRAMEIVDESVSSTQSNQRAEIERCIQIGLLCVQESAMDRPTMSVVVLMLSNDTVLASPKQPAFILKTSYTNIEDPSTSSGGTNSVNSMSETVLLPR